MRLVVPRRTIGIALATVASLAATMTGADASGIVPEHACSSGGSYFDLNAPIVTVRDQVGPTYTNHNGTRSSQLATFTESKATTVSMTKTLTGTLEAGVIFEKVSASVSVALLKSYTTTTGDNQSVNIPAGKWALGRFGVTEVQTSGTFYSVNNACQRYNVVHESKISIPENSQGWVVEIRSSNSW